MVNNQGSKEQTRARLCGFICSFIYLALFFLSFYTIVFVPQLYGNPDVTGTIGIVLVFLSLCVPLSIVVSIGLIWNRYLAQDYKMLYLSCLIPIVTLLVVVLLMKFVQLLFM